LAFRPGFDLKVSMSGLTHLKIVSWALTAAIVVVILALSFREIQSDRSEDRSKIFPTPSIEGGHRQQPSV